MVYNFEVISLEKTEYDFVVFSKSIESPLHNIPAICSAIKEQYPYECKIMFDMLLSIGNTSDRFVEAKFDGECIIVETITSKKIAKKSDLRQIGLNYLLNNDAILERSILTSVQKKLLKRGIAI